MLKYELCRWPYYISMLKDMVCMLNHERTIIWWMKMRQLKRGQSSFPQNNFQIAGKYSADPDSSVGFNDSLSLGHHSTILSHLQSSTLLSYWCEDTTWFGQWKLADHTQVVLWNIFDLGFALLAFPRKQCVPGSCLTRANPEPDLKPSSL